MASEVFFLTFGIFILVFGLLISVVAIITVIGQWFVFQKAGRPGWAAVIPFYNNWVLYEISGINPIFSLLVIGGVLLSSIGSSIQVFSNQEPAMMILAVSFSLVSLLFSIPALVFNIMASLNLAKNFGKSDAYGLGLAFLGPIFYPMLGFDKKAVYNKVK